MAFTACAHYRCVPVSAQLACLPSCCSCTLPLLANLLPADINLMPRGIHTRARTHTRTHTHTYTHTSSLAQVQGSQVVLAWHEGCFVVPALDFRTTFPSECTPASLLRWCHACNIYTQIRLFGRQRNGRRSDCRGRSTQFPSSPVLAFIYFCTIPLGYHPRFVRTAENSAVPQNGIIVASLSSTPVIAPLAVPGSARRCRGQCSAQYNSGLLIGVCQRMQVSPLPAHPAESPAFPLLACVPSSFLPITPHHSSPCSPTACLRTLPLLACHACAPCRSVLAMLAHPAAACSPCLRTLPLLAWPQAACPADICIPEGPRSRAKQSSEPPHAARVLSICCTP